jgi:hypothetical protein
VSFVCRACGVASNDARERKQRYCDRCYEIELEKFVELESRIKAVHLIQFVLKPDVEPNEEEWTSVSIALTRGIPVLVVALDGAAVLPRLRREAAAVVEGPNAPETFVRAEAVQKRILKSLAAAQN